MIGIIIKKGEGIPPLRPFQSVKIFLLGCSPAEPKSASLDPIKLLFYNIPFQENMPSKTQYEKIFAFC